MIISPAFAQAAGAATAPNPIVQLVPFLLIFVVMYFFIIRPQQKKAAAHREMVSQLKKGDEVITSGGLIGKVTKEINEREIQVELAENVRVKFLRSSVLEKRTS